MAKRLSKKRLSCLLESLYRTYNRRELVSPDPLQFLYEYREPEDRELVGFVASSLAYGRVAMILSSVARLLAPLGSHPRAALADATRSSLIDSWGDFKHRFTPVAEVADVLLAVRDVIGDGTIGSWIGKSFSRTSDLTASWDEFAGAVEDQTGRTSLVCRPSRKSSCKRAFLFMRWMVRHDGVDPGGWDDVPPSALVVPLDTHMFRVARLFGLTRRKGAGLATAREITEAFRRLRPDDPVRYDFTLTRWGIRPDMTYRELERIAEGADEP